MNDNVKKEPEYDEYSISKAFIAMCDANEDDGDLLNQRVIGPSQEMMDSFYYTEQPNINISDFVDIKE